MLVLGVRTAITRTYLQGNVYHVNLTNFQNHVAGVLNIPLNITTLTIFRRSLNFHKVMSHQLTKNLGTLQSM
jgi:hypothetical protein